MTCFEARLLVVDDNEDNRYTLRQRLKRQGYANVETATNGREALELLGQREIDLVLLDVMMPEMNGYEVLEQLKADPRRRDIPVIMISALDQLESVIRCVELGAEDYLPKPFNPTLLAARVGASLEKKRLRDELRASLSRLEKELEAARRLQVSMLPREFPACTEQQPVDIHALMQAAREVGGDLYDFFYPSPDRLCFLVADVSGKGADAAMFMARTRSLVRMAVELLHEVGATDVAPDRVLNTVNRELCQNNREKMFVSVFMGTLDVRTGALAFANAGHPPPCRISAARRIERLGSAPQPPLGIRPAARYTTSAIELEVADTLFVCTDGVCEAANASGEMYGDERLQALLEVSGDSSAQAVVTQVKDAIDAFAAGAPPADDVTMLALRWRPTAAGR
ncbi:MAG: fused response regulator/phosphatase [Proteobacteria bacterium]|nr:fused response regulator/phosphatase [Pseudomonadota bacterium]